jgi:hypothetical protein
VPASATMQIKGTNLNVGQLLNQHCCRIFAHLRVERGRIMSSAYPNAAQQKANLESFFQKMENKHKYGVRSSSKCLSTRSYVKPTRAPSETDAALLKRATKSPLDSPKRSSVLRDPKLEMERQRNLENRQKYSPANLKNARRAPQSPIPKPDAKGLKTIAKVRSRFFIEFLLNYIV